MKAVIEQCHGLLLGAFVGLVFRYQSFDLTSQETAYRSGPLRCGNLRLLNGLPIKRDGKILLSGGFWRFHLGPL